MNPLGSFPRSLLRYCAALAMLLALSGCIAAVAVPLVAGGMLKARDTARVRAATRISKAPGEPKGRAPNAAPSASVTVRLATAEEIAKFENPGQSAAPPNEPSAYDLWRPFFDYALTHAKAHATAPEAALPSAVLAAGGNIAAPIRRPCTSPHPAVIIDLDEGSTPFSPSNAGIAPPDVANGLQRLRQAGVVILWISQLPSARVADVAGALRASGFDPKNADQLLLRRGSDDRKQALRADSTADVCVIAIAGDRRADFDELFDYLRNPAGAAGLYPMMDQGWFLMPAPFGTSLPEQ
ncbi:MAG: hypothetical protein ABIP41_02295 [Croceibacterium sp.]